MDDGFTDRAPSARKVLSFMSSRVWNWKWLIVAASVGAAVLVAIFYRPDTTLIASGRAVLTIGLAPSIEYIAQASGPALPPLESTRSLVMRISDPAFRAKTANSTKFDEKTAGFSKSMVNASLKGVAIEGERDVAIELSAGSPEDVLAALGTVTDEILKVHAEIASRRLAPLRARIEQAKTRVTEIEKASRELNDRIFNLEADARGRDKAFPLVFPAPSFAGAIPTWNQLMDRIQSDSNIIALAEPSVVRVEPTLTVPVSSIGTLKASVLAGLVMLLAMIFLTLVINTRTRS